MNALDAQECKVDFPSNEQLADKLETASCLLLEQGANRFRAEAYHRASETIRGLERPAWTVYLADGIAGLDEIPNVGTSIAKALQQMIRGGRWPLLERLQGNDVAEHAFATVPGIGSKLAKRIHDELGVENLAELQAASWDGRLTKIGGFGEKRIRGVRESLAARGRHHRQTIDSESLNSVQKTNASASGESTFSAQDIDATNGISIAEILDIDNEYRFKALKNQLPCVAPKRMNPSAEAWLPILHADREGRHYTAMYSNTEHAHAMGRTHDWVVIYLEDHSNHGLHGRWTVISSQFGKLRGKRIVRGREKECAEFYSAKTKK